MKIIVDTREKQPWTFDNVSTAEILHQKLNTGDYSLHGYEDVLSIERKMGVGEIANNITQKRFWNEMKRLSEIKHAFLLLECGYAQILDYPASLNVRESTRDKIKIRGPFILRKLSNIQIGYGIHVIPCGHRYYAEQVATSIFKRVLEQYG